MPGDGDVSDLAVSGSGSVATIIECSRVLGLFLGQPTRFVSRFGGSVGVSAKDSGLDREALFSTELGAFSSGA